ncbi:mitochondrial tRNA specific 2 thiouridylase [Trichuris trichiura]|uniref:tRNA-5-taurinomethyluridine 2-sulfurtransferase n=1 Tax=Trichuris trichiura TaxID=36087 RepID=A0A077Z3Q7_TRITR|nr:mitochondrial tRNA specific 2 thiouridylase [Trichuris trichiura]
MSLQRMFKKVACAISGGIDSAMAAYLLKERGFDVIGVYMHNWDTNEEGSSCTSNGDFLDATKVADHLKLPLQRVDFVRQYWLDVFSHTVDSYRLGISANPDVLCNRFIKFGSFFRYAINRLRVDAIATGHYARSSFGSYLEQYSSTKSELKMVSWKGSFRRFCVDAVLLRPKDRFKDQTYFLCQVPQSALARTMFPLATLLKDEVRELARHVGLGWLCAKPESVGICMVGPRRFPKFIDQVVGGSASPLGNVVYPLQYIEPKRGKLIDVDTGTVVHEHEGIHLYTIGQRVGIGGLDHGYYVTKICPNSGDIYVCACNFHPAMYSRALFTAEPHWISDEVPEMPKRYSLKTRHPSRTVPCRASCLQGSNKLYVQLDFPARALSSGQYAVLYEGDRCLGGACIERTEPFIVHALK